MMNNYLFETCRGQFNWNKLMRGSLHLVGHSQVNILRVYFVHGDRGSTVVKVLCYKSEGHWFDSRWCHWNFSLT